MAAIEGCRGRASKRRSTPGCPQASPPWLLAAAGGWEQTPRELGVGRRFATSSLVHGLCWARSAAQFALRRHLVPPCSSQRCSVVLGEPLRQKQQRADMAALLCAQLSSLRISARVGVLQRP